MLFAFRFSLFAFATSMKDLKDERSERNPPNLFTFFTLRFAFCVLLSRARHSQRKEIPSTTSTNCRSSLSLSSSSSGVVLLFYFCLQKQSLHECLRHKHNTTTQHNDRFIFLSLENPTTFQHSTTTTKASKIFY